jgi:periplasmic protein TonB
MTWEDLQRSTKSSADNGKVSGDDPFHDFLGKGFEEKPLWTGLYENFRDAVFTRKLPPLELTSTPVATPDRMAARTNRWAIGGATIANGGVLAILILMGLSATIRPIPISSSGRDVRLKDFTLFAPARGGDGGGANEQTDPIMGRPPRREDMPLAPVQVAVLERPTIAVEPAAPIEIPDNSSLPNIGVQKSANVSLDSSGPGKWTGIGTGPDGGDGPGGGSGPGSDRGPGDSVYTAGTGGVTNPVPIVSPEAEFSDEARRNKYQGVCMISVIVDARGYPQNPRVLRSLGMGLDEKALEAVQKYRFKPAMKNGKPVAAMISVEVNFRLY